MGNFSSKEIKRAIRDFESAAMDVLNSDYGTYKVRIKTFIELIKKNDVIRTIVGPLLEREVNFDEIYKNGNGFWIDQLNLPAELDGQLAYVLKVLEKVANGSHELETISHRLYKNRNIEYNIKSWLISVAQPSFRELNYKLNDLIEDEVEGKDSVSETSLQIFNYGSITATQGSNIAIGKDIQQTTIYKNIANEIIEKVKSENIISEDKISEVEKVSKEIEEEINKKEPSQNKLKELARKLYDIGENGLLKVVTTVVTDPRWGQAVADILLNV